MLEQQFTKMPKSSVDEAEKEIARARFERHFGTLSHDNAASLDNESIDADLAREHANSYEDE